MFKYLKNNVIIIINKKKNIYFQKVHNPRSKSYTERYDRKLSPVFSVISVIYHPQRRPLPLLTYNAEAFFLLFT